MATASALQLFPPGLGLGVGLGRDSVRLRVRVLLPVLQRVIHAVPIREDAGPSPPHDDSRDRDRRRSRSR